MPARVSLALNTERDFDLEEGVGMACWIESHCNACGLCLGVCPVWAVREHDGHVWIDPSFCTECLGYAELPVCGAVCPIDAIGGFVAGEASLPAVTRGFDLQEMRR
jgi:ferredoxin